MLTPANLISKNNQPANQRLNQKRLMQGKKRQKSKQFVNETEKKWILNYSHLFIPLY